MNGLQLIIITDIIIVIKESILSLKKEDVYKIIPKETLSEIFEEFELDIEEGIHGFSHWARVVDNGIEICKNNGANPNVVIGFGLFHDVQRENDNDDPDHGWRGGELLMKYRDKINLTDEEIFKVKDACSGHTDELHDDDLDIGTCWDSDRLDLYRVGIEPDPEYLNNEYSMDESVIDRACDRAEMEYMSPWAEEIYGEVIIPMLEKKEKLKLEKLEKESKEKFEEFFKDAYFLPVAQREQNEIGYNTEKPDIYSDEAYHEFHREDYQEIIVESENYQLIAENYKTGCVFELRENELHWREEEKRTIAGDDDPYSLLKWACQKYDNEKLSYAHDIESLTNKEAVLKAIREMKKTLKLEQEHQNQYKRELEPKVEQEIEKRKKLKIKM